MTGSLSDCCVSYQVGTRSSPRLTWWVQCPQITSTQHVVNVTRIVRTAPSEPLHLRKDTTTPHSGAMFSKISPTVEFIRNEHVNYTGKNNVTAFHMGKRWKLHVLYWSLFKCCVTCPVSQTFFILASKENSFSCRKLWNVISQKIGGALSRFCRNTVWEYRKWDLVSLFVQK